KYSPYLSGKKCLNDFEGLCEGARSGDECGLALHPPRRRKLETSSAMPDRRFATTGERLQPSQPEAYGFGGAADSDAPFIALENRRAAPLASSGQQT
ncbi:MAG: hypothetical protein AAF938_24940, partial [Myxococcota bacterium]